MEPNDPTLKVLYAYTRALSVALDYRDQPTRLHSERVRDLSAAIATRHGLSGSDLEALRIAASFHDIGKIGIPDSILMKTGLFTPEEWKAMQRHSAIGADIIAATGIEGAQLAAQVIRHHHEHFDGSGYPDGLAGEDIPVCARIISIADSYDAMAVTRSYHEAKPHTEVMAILRAESGIKHDPALLEVFCEMVESDEFRATRP
jgi:HD-GYP domain-containing protein (c-di-GMP phosphodiesterase class II)